VPELPEVEIAARNLRAWAEGRRIEAVEIEDKARRMIRPLTPAALAKALTGRSVNSIRRVGKQLLITLGDGEPLGLLSHLGMTGKWLRRAPGEEPPSHSRARLRLEGGEVLHYRDPRLFGRLRLVPGARFEELPDIAALGPDPLEAGIDPVRLRAALSRTTRSIKVALLDQRICAGVGNIYAAEALFRARVDPRRKARALKPLEVKRLADGVLASMRQAIRDQESPEIVYVEEGGENRFQVYGRAKERCPRCRKAAIRRIVQAQRSTFFCPSCQK
jgi:formamidopyrimidine-DNA glycosylase